MKLVLVQKKMLNPSGSIGQNNIKWLCNYMKKKKKIMVKKTKEKIPAGFLPNNTVI